MSVELFDTSFVEGNKYHWYNRIIAAVLELTTIAFCLYHACLMYSWRFKGFQSNKKTAGVASAAKWRKLSHIFTILTLILFSIMGANYVLNIWSVYGSNTSCNVIEIFSVLSYHLCKLCLYIVLILRIKVAFSESAYHDNIQKILYFLYIILFIYIVLILYGDFTVIKGKILYTSSDMFYCLLLPLPTWGLAAFLILDIIISFTCCAVFIYPLRQLLKLTNERSQQIYIEIIRKYAILTTTTIVSTFVFVFLNAVLHIGFLVLMDNVMNTLCILLMSSWYDNLYDTLCCCCTKTIATLDDAMSSNSRTSNVKGKYHQQFGSVDISSTTRNGSNDYDGVNDKKAVIPLTTLNEEKSNSDSEVP